VRVVTWNMGCSYGNRYRSSQARTWPQFLAWYPDVGLVQETMNPSEWLPGRRGLRRVYARRDA